mmetsp:Transcript_52453/g.119450  ORF Transcript_52453/g.119450 Transcript_52453/m.119450 type:complete len:272 (+) Transcript_52453:801-1616(+)
MHHPVHHIHGHHVQRPPRIRGEHGRLVILRGVVVLARRIPLHRGGIIDVAPDQTHGGPVPEAGKQRRRAEVDIIVGAEEELAMWGVVVHPCKHLPRLQGQVAVALHHRQLDHVPGVLYLLVHLILPGPNKKTIGIQVCHDDPDPSSPHGVPQLAIGASGHNSHENGPWVGPAAAGGERVALGQQFPSVAAQPTRHVSKPAPERLVVVVVQHILHDLHVATAEFHVIRVLGVGEQITEVSDGGRGVQAPHALHGFAHVEGESKNFVVRRAVS